MSVTELETRIVKMQEWEQLAQDAAAEAEARHHQSGNAGA